MNFVSPKMESSIIPFVQGSALKCLSDFFADDVITPSPLMGRFPVTSIRYAHKCIGIVIQYTVRREDIQHLDNTGLCSI